MTHVRVVRSFGTEDFLGIVDCTIKLHKGSLVFYGGFRLSELSGAGTTLPVTGGTGAYSQARGTVTVKHDKLANQGGALLNFEITRK